VVIGGGGHAKVVIDVLQENGVPVTAFTSSNPEPDTLLGVPRAGGDEILPELFAQGVRQAFVALGDNRIRWERLTWAAALGFSLINVISQRAHVSRHASCGQGVLVMPGAAVNAGARLDDGVIINTNASVDHDCEIGACAHVAPNAALAGRVRVGEGAFLGTGCSVIPGLEIGAWAIVGAGAVVIESLVGSRVYAGVPARMIPSKDLAEN
jgi:UDP-perosamine 4-acetyltransferase